MAGDSGLTSTKRGTDEFGVYVGNLPCSITEEEICELIQAFETVKLIRLVKKDKKTFCFLSCDSTEQVLEVVQTLDKTEIMGRNICVRALNNEIQERCTMHERDYRSRSSVTSNKNRTAANEYVSSYSSAQYFDDRRMHSSKFHGNSDSVKNANKIASGNEFHHEMSRKEYYNNPPPLGRGAQFAISKYESDSVPLDSARNANHKLMPLGRATNLRTAKPANNGYSHNNLAMGSGRGSSGLLPPPPLSPVQLQGKCTRNKPPPLIPISQYQNEDCDVPSYMSDSYDRKLHRSETQPQCRLKNEPHQFEDITNDRCDIRASNHDRGFSQASSNRVEYSNRSIRNNEQLTDHGEVWDQQQVYKHYSPANNKIPNIGPPTDFDKFSVQRLPPGRDRDSMVSGRSSPNFEKVDVYEGRDNSRAGSSFSDEQHTTSNKHMTGIHWPQHEDHEKKSGNVQSSSINQSSELLCVSNFPFHTTKEEIFALFEDFDPLDVWIISNEYRKGQCTEAYVAVADEKLALEAILQRDNTEYKRRTLLVTDIKDTNALDDLITIHSN